MDSKDLLEEIQRLNPSVKEAKDKFDKLDKEVDRLTKAIAYIANQINAIKAEPKKFADSLEDYNEKLYQYSAAREQYERAAAVADANRVEALNKYTELFERARDAYFENKSSIEDHTKAIEEATKAVQKETVVEEKVAEVKQAEVKVEEKIVEVKQEEIKETKKATEVKKAAVQATKKADVVNKEEATATKKVVEAKKNLANEINNQTKKVKSTKAATPKLSPLQAMREAVLNDFFNGTDKEVGASSYLANPQQARAELIKSLSTNRARKPETFMAAVRQNFNNLSNTGTIQYKSKAHQDELQSYLTKGHFDKGNVQEKTISAPQKKESEELPTSGIGSDKKDTSTEIASKTLARAKRKQAEKIEAEVNATQETLDFNGIANKHLDRLNKTLGSLNANMITMSTNVGRMAMITKSAAYGLTAVRKKIENSELLKGIEGLGKALEKATKKMDSLGKARVKSSSAGTMGSAATAAVEEEKVLEPEKVQEIKRPKSSHANQERKNQKRAEQKGFLALLIPALAKLLRKSPIWDAIKLLLLKFGKNHPLLTAGALMAGPGLIAGGIGLKAMGGLKGLGNMFKFGGGAGAGAAVGATGASATRAGRLAKVKFGRMAQSAGDWWNGLGVRAESNVANKITSVQDTRRSLFELQSSKETQLQRLLDKEAKLRGYQGKASAEYQHLNRGAHLSYKERSRRVTLYDEIEKRGRKIGRVRREIGTYQGKLGSIDKYLDRNLKELDELTKAQRNLKTPMGSLAGKLKVFGSDITGAGKNLLKSIKMPKMTWAGAGKGALKMVNPMTGAKILGNVGKGAKALGPIGIALSAIAEVPDLFNAAKSGEPGAFKKQATKSVGGITGSMAGAGIGGAIGTAIAPGIGTALGTALGAIIGDIAGRILGPAFMDGFSVFGKDFKKDFKALWDGIKAVFGSVMKVVTVVGSVIGRLLVPVFKVLGFTIGGLVKLVTWGINIIAKVIGGVANAVTSVVDTIDKGLKNLWDGLKRNPLTAPIAKGLEKVFGTSGDSSDNGGGSSNPSAVSKDDAQYNGGGSSDKLVGSAVGAVKNFTDNVTSNKSGTRTKKKGQDKSVGMCATGVTRAVKDAYGVQLTGDAWQLADQLAKNDKFTELTGYSEKTALKDIPKGAIVVQGKNAKNQYGHTFISGGDGKGYSDHTQTQMYKGYGGMRVFMPTDSLNINGDAAVATTTPTDTTSATATDTATDTSTAVTQQADDGVREALLAFAGNMKKDQQNNRTRNLIFEATDVTGSLGCWGITHVNNTGQMLH